MVYCAVDSDGQFQHYNTAFLSVLKTSSTELRKKIVWDILTAPDQQNLREILDSDNQTYNKRVRLNFVDSFNMPHTLDCLIQNCPSKAFTLVGEEPQDFNQTRFEELMSIQNEMTVMRREELKNAKRLLENNEFLDRIVTERTKELQLHKQKLRALLVELTLIEQRERQKLASDLHDLLAQLLVACTIELSQIDKSGMSSQNQDIVEMIDTMLDRALTFTRTLIADLHPTILQHKGLLAALQWLASDMLRFGLLVAAPQDVRSVRITEEMSVLLYKTVRELFFNVLKHSGAKTASIHWECESDRELLIRIKDSGKGFDLQTKILEQAPGHLGLFYYQERLEAIGGALDIVSSPDAGTTVTIKVLLERSTTQSPAK